MTIVVKDSDRGYIIVKAPLLIYCGIIIVLIITRKFKDVICCKRIMSLRKAERIDVITLLPLDTVFIFSCPKCQNDASLNLDTGKIVHNFPTKTSP